MSIRRFVAVLAILALSAGCSGRNNTTNPENEQWFCQSNELGDGWECVQDANLAQVPVPTRMPPEPEPEPVNLDDPLDLDALTGPLQRNPNLPAEPMAVPLPDASAPQTPAPGSQPTPAASASDPDSPPAAPDSQPGSVPPPPEMTDRAAPPAAPSSSQVPKHIALAYVTPEPTPILQLPADYYALQMLAMNSTEEIETYINDNDLKGMAGARIEDEGQIYYVLIVGIYDGQYPLLTTTGMGDSYCRSLA
jgi:hypothetical protein